MSAVMNSLTISRDNKTGGDYKWGVYKHKIGKLGRYVAPSCTSREFRNTGPSALTPVNTVYRPRKIKPLVRASDEWVLQELKCRCTERFLWFEELIFLSY
jgi:hypothetical protein